MNKNNIIILLLTSLLFWSCDGGETPNPKPPTPPKQAPDAVVLSSPANNSACLKGSSETGSTSTVAFSWNKAAHAESYQLEVKNLLTQQVSSFTTTNLTYSTALTVNTPYSWSVTSVNSVGKTVGTVWKFYLAGTAASSYAPFPAKLITPVQGEIIDAKGAASVEVAFSWEGADVDNDISSFALYLDNENATTEVIASQTETTAKQTLQSGKTYFWKIVTTDKAGNKSESVVSVFMLK